MCTNIYTIKSAVEYHLNIFAVSVEGWLREIPESFLRAEEVFLPGEGLIPCRFLWVYHLNTQSAKVYNFCGFFVICCKMLQKPAHRSRNYGIMLLSTSGPYIFYFNKWSWLQLKTHCNLLYYYVV